MTDPVPAEPEPADLVPADPVPVEAVSDEEALRRLERVADRLRVVGPRLAGREGPAAENLLGQIRAGLQRLADLAAAADGEPRRPVPVLAAHALGDQVLVLGHDLLGPHTSLQGGARGRRSDQVRAAALQTLDEVNLLI
jgi:hypothetical protein